MVIDNAKTLYRQVLLGTGNSRYWQMLQLQPQEYVLAPYLSALKPLEAVDLLADSDVIAMVYM